MQTNAPDTATEERCRDKAEGKTEGAIYRPGNRSGFQSNAAQRRASTKNARTWEDLGSKRRAQGGMYGRHLPPAGRVKEDERDKQNELPSRATRSAIYEKNYYSRSGKWLAFSVENVD